MRLGTALCFGGATCLVSANVAVAQDLEPRRWTHLPIDINVVGFTYVYTRGDLQLDPTIGIEDATVEMHTVLASYSRTLALFDQTARLDVQVPIQSGDWDGMLAGETRSVTRNGLGDPRLRLSLDIAGAPALAGEEFVAYRASHPEDTIVGAALAVRLPLGEYNEDKLINLGENRLVFEPQLGILHTIGRWSFELTGSMFIYSDNDEFFNGATLEQDPLYAVQAHVVRTFETGWWVSAGAAYGTGAESAINGVANGDERRNLLYGASIGFPVGPSQSVHLGYLRREALADAGVSTHNFYVGWSVRF
jgi:hypothetical protein